MWGVLNPGVSLLAITREGVGPSFLRGEDIKPRGGGCPAWSRQQTKGFITGKGLGGHQEMPSAWGGGNPGTRSALATDLLVTQTAKWRPFVSPNRGGCGEKGRLQGPTAGPAHTVAVGRPPPTFPS